MADATKPRAVSGEIMTDPLDAAAAQPPPGGDIAVGEVIDAEYITLPSGQSRAEPTIRESLRSIVSAAPPVTGMDMLRRPRESAAPQKPARGGPLFWALGVGLAVAAFWVSGGHALVRGSPFIGVDTSHSALRISGVTSRIDDLGARSILLVDGEATNDGGGVAHMPPLDIAVTGNDGRIISYRLGTSGRPMAAGETFAFSSRLDVPKNGVKTVSVTFGE